MTTPAPNSTAGRNSNSLPPSGGDVSGGAIPRRTAGAPMGRGPMGGAVPWEVDRWATGRWG